ncbi:hypothetical protein [Algoriphagus vanfongensis]|uniref:hypothetical protein n=1 Tax=Algoriphagus vanfongensis TaxID=426371 RepID=UPI0012F81EAD|nr:hypothetical protein [Algoriphagus vanfongensis]
MDCQSLFTNRNIGRGTMNFLCAFLLFLATDLFAQSDTTTVEEMVKKRQDPVSGLRSVFLQEVLLPVADGTASSFSIQPVWPFKLGENLKLITYTIIPFQKIPPLEPGLTKESGMGNILFNGYFSPTHTPGRFRWGVGPAIQIPTRTNPALGSNKVAMGPSALLYYSGDKLSGGVVLQNYWSLGGTGVNEVNSFSMQYIAYYNLPNGWFLESNSTIVANWLQESDKWLIPIGGGPGKMFKMGGLFYCAAVQWFYNAATPAYVGDWEGVFQLQVIF